MKPWGSRERTMKLTLLRLRLTPPSAWSSPSRALRPMHTRSEGQHDMGAFRSVASQALCYEVVGCSQMQG